MLLYQSASGDAADGTSVFTMNGGEMTCQSGAMFYCTNTKSVINLNGAGLNLSEEGELLIVSQGRWGKDGKNGGDCTLNACHQTLEGEIAVDGLSKLALNLTDSEWTGSFSGKGLISVSLDADSVWTLTDDCEIAAFSGDPNCVNLNGHTLYIDGAPIGA